MEKVIWIFTDSKNILVANKGKEWKIKDWSKEILIVGKIKINVPKLIEAI